VNWSDSNSGSICKVALSGGAPEKISSKKGIYRTPSYSHDGKWLVYEREGGSNILGPAYTAKPVSILCLLRRE